MQALRVVMLLVTVAIVYLLFFRSVQPATSPSAAQNELTAPLISPKALPAANRPQATPVAHTQYKQAMDRAHEARKQMEEQRADADAAGN